MNDLVTRKFKDKYLNSLIWDDEVCWVGVDIVEYFGYTQKRKAINDCIRTEKLQEGRDYKTLSGEELKAFKEVFVEVLEEIKFAPKIIIFYERGLYRFLAYTKMPLGIEFREWIASDIMPTLREKGYYVMEGVELPTQNIQKPEIVHNDSDYSKFSTEKMERYRIALETVKFFEGRIDKITQDPIYKFLFFKQIFVDAGLELPSFIEEELRTF
ncbi:BRO family protein [uncultured Clostridium sp.]|uniref:BRO family protein n=1 Tax=uncultured Clostridium sp. TaxID=59620 RepID=UPI002614341D|nr:BRO family protein [uncultured Clostridium sp.]